VSKQNGWNELACGGSTDKLMSHFLTCYIPPYLFSSRLDRNFRKGGDTCVFARSRLESKYLLNAARERGRTFDCILLSGQSRPEPIVAKSISQ
jgi:hypothetical protein